MKSDNKPKQQVEKKPNQEVKKDAKQPKNEFLSIIEKNEVKNPPIKNKEPVRHKFEDLQDLMKG